MKKILLFLLIGSGLWSCSVDNEDNVVYNEQSFEKAESQLSAATLSTCFINLSGQVHVDVSNGIGNPVVVFTPVIAGVVPAASKFKVKVEVQPLSDCDDMNSNTGTLLTFGPSGTVQNVMSSPPTVAVLPVNMTLCYKWRFVFEGVTTGQKSPTCRSESIWYESPLF